MNHGDWLAQAWWWIEVHTGTVNESGPYYAFWSGFGSDIAEIALVGAIYTAARHANCHVQHCWRIGKPVDGTPYRACHLHHPDHQGDKRAVTLKTILDAHSGPRR